MKLYNFILGVLGVILIVASFSYFIPLVFLGGISTGSLAFAFGFPIFLIILGATIVYFGFYYPKSNNKDNNETIKIAKWGIIYTIAIWISSFIISKLFIVNNFYSILITALIVSIVVQAVRNHEDEYDFQIRWFVFYYLVYANLIWLTDEYLFPNFAFQSGLLTHVVLGFVLAGAAMIIQKIRIRHNSVSWMSFVLVLILIVANLGHLQSIPSINNFKSSSQNTSELSEDKQLCPTPMFSIVGGHPFRLSESSFYSIQSLREPIKLENLVDKDVWKIENNFRTCYKGKYKGQYPDRFYCDDLIISRWDLSSSGAISYRWYTAVTAEFIPDKGSYIFSAFSCENGNKLTVNKETTTYYVHVSRDGTEIKVQY